MKYKKRIFPILAVLFLCCCPVILGEIFSLHDLAIDHFREYINEMNWYWGKYSNFQGLGSTTGYRIYKLELTKGKIVGEKARYYLALEHKTGPNNQIALLELSVYDDGMRNNNEVRWFGSIEKAEALMGEKSAIQVKKGVINLQPSKPKYGNVGQREKELKKMVVKTLESKGINQYKLVKGRYSLYIKRMSEKDNYCTLLLINSAKSQFYTTFGNVGDYIGNLTYIKPELRLELKRPTTPAEVYFLERVKRNSLKYTVTL
jgi:hypothetical protein